MKVALASAKFINCDLAFNISQIEKHMREAKESGAELLCFGESYLQGFECLKWNFEIDKNMAITLSSPKFLHLCKLTKEFSIDLLFGFIERDGDNLYSSCAILSDGKLLHLYRRISRGWKEFWHTDAHYREGTEVQLFSYKNRKCLIALCGDLWDFPERFTQNADLLFWPIFVNFSIESWEKTELAEYTEHAKQICPKTLLINSIVESKEPAFGGCYCFSDGKVPASLPMGNEGLLIVDV